MSRSDRMKNYGIFVLLLLIACISCACLDSTPSQPSATDGMGDAGIRWYSYEEGMKIAEEQNKPAMVDLYTDWCTWCEELDKVVYTDPDVIELADEFVCIKINVGGRRDIAVPTIVFLRSDGTEVHRIRGYPIWYLFSWDDVPGNDNELVGCLKEVYNLDWAESAEIHKSDDGKSIRIFNNKNSAEITVDMNERKATLKISDGRTYDLKAVRDRIRTSNELWIYRKDSDVFIHEMMVALSKA